MKNGKQTLESMNQAVWYNKWTLNKFKKFLNGEILEVGCGIGNFTSTLVNYGQVWAIDINNEYIEKTKDKVKGKARVGFGDIEKGKYFFPSRKFDVIVCLNVLEHIKDDAAAGNNLYQLLRKGGKLILLAPAHWFLYGEIDRSIGHFRRYNKRGLIKQLGGVGFKVTWSRNINFLGALGWFITGRILKKEKVDGKAIKIFNLIAPFFLSPEDLFEPPIGTSILVVAKKP